MNSSPWGARDFHANTG